MRRLAIVFCVFILGIGLSQQSIAEDQPIKEMAGMLMHLNHYPSNTEKRRLSKIAGDAHYSANTRTIARAIMNLHHKATADDKAALEKVIESGDATNQEKEMARIVRTLNHKPSSDDKQKLQAMM